MTRRHPATSLRPRESLIAVAAMLAASAQADTFTTDNGVEVRWSASASIGAAWRAKDADPALISVGNGGLSGIANDDGNLNFKKRDAYSSAVNLIGEVDVRKDKLGLFARAKAWHDFTLSSTGVPHGSYANGYEPGAKLDDSGFDRLSRFEGAALLDAYARTEFKLGDHAMAIRLGQQVVNWGESLFVPGINQFGAFDLTAAHRPGAQVKEILKPIPQLFASVGVAQGVSVEAFYQMARTRTTLDGCGTYWSPADVVNCGKGALIGAGPFTDQQMYTGVAPLGGANFRMDLAPERRPSRDGQFGLAMRLRAEPLDTDFGLHYAQYNTRTPNLSAETIATSVPGSVWGMTIPGSSRAMRLQMDYSASHIKVAGLSFSTVAGGWPISGEISHTSGVPLQINGVDLLNGIVAGVGPQGALVASPANAYVPGYARKSKTQVQLNTLQVLPRVLGAEAVTVLAEVAAQSWSGIENASAGGARYGRAFVFGSGPVAIPGLGDICATLNANPTYCENKGYATKHAWGLRVMAEANYPGVVAGINLKPRLFFSRDVKGWSGDGYFSEGRTTLSPGLRFEYRNQYYVDMAYARFARAKYDEMHDRDFYSLSAGVQF